MRIVRHMEKKMIYDYNCDRLYNGIASVRSYVIDECIKKRLDLRISIKGTNRKMTIPWEHLGSPIMFQTQTKEFKSKFDGKVYTLKDFKFIDDKLNAPTN